MPFATDNEIKIDHDVLLKGKNPFGLANLIETKS
jgi:hypothetical protein